MCIQVYECIYVSVRLCVCVCIVYNIRNEQISYYHPMGVREGVDRGDGMSIRTAVARASPSDNRVCRVYRTFSRTAPSPSPLVQPCTATAAEYATTLVLHHGLPPLSRPSVFRHARQCPSVKIYGGVRMTNQFTSQKKKNKQTPS